MNDAMHFRPSFGRILSEPSARTAHRRLHKSYFRYVRKLVIIFHLLIAFWECPPASGTVIGLELFELLVCCGTYCLELYLVYRIMGHKHFVKDWWCIIKAIFLIVT